MAKEAHLHSDMAKARQSDGINVIFDQKSPASRDSRSRSRSSGGSSHSSGKRGRVSRRERHRSSSTSSRSSSPRSRSRSYPRCHRQSSRCRCDNHRRYGRGRPRRSSPRRYRARSRSYSRSPSSSRYSQRRRDRSGSRSSVRLSRRPKSPYRSRVSSPQKKSPSRSSERPAGLSLLDKQELLEAAEENAEKMLGVEEVELPESVTPISPEQTADSPRLSPEQTAESPRFSPEQWTRVSPSPEKTPSQQSDDEEADDMSSPSMSPKRKMISFSINNSVAKPTVAATPCAKVTPRVDSYESRKPYGHWIPVRSGQTSRKRKHTLTKSH